MKNLKAVIEAASSIALGGHVRPDGDCIGALAAVKEYIRINYQGKTVDCFVENVPAALAFLTEEDFLCRKHAGNYDLFIALDCADSKRLGAAESVFDAAAARVCIDHHISNPGYAQMNIIDGAISSTCELLCTLMDFSKMNQKTAVSLYTGIIHDTGVLQYSNTKPQTLKTVAALLEFDIPFSEIIEKSFYSKTYVQNLLLGLSLSKSRLVLENNCIISMVSMEEQAQIGAADEDFEGIVSQLRLTEECQMAVLMHESKAGEWRVSMRSKGKIDLIPIAAANGGGGHRVAAGCTMYGTAAVVYEKLLKDIEENFT